MLSLLAMCAGSFRGAAAQGTPAAAVVASFATPLAAPTGLGQIGQSAVTSYGDLVFVDQKNDAVYEYPAGGGSVITLVSPGGLDNGYGTGANAGIVIDSSNAIYLEGNYSNCILRFPYDAAKNTWDGLATLTKAKPSSNCAAPYLFAQYGNISGPSPNYFQPAALALMANGNIFVTTQTSGNNDDFVLPVIGTGASATAGVATSFVLSKETKPAQSAAVDPFGNYYIVEGSGGLPGVLMIPAGSSNVASDAGLARVDPSLANVVGVTTDAAGNLYISDSKLGVFFVPNPKGTPETAAASLLSPVAASYQVTIDNARNIVYVPTYDASGNPEFVAVRLGVAELGTAATAATTATSGAATFSFNSAVTPNFVIKEAGATTPDFTVATGGTCVSGTAVTAPSSCTVNLAFTPHAAGSVSAKLLAVDGSGNVLAGINLHGTGSGSAIQVLPAGELMIGTGLKTPSQVAADPGKNVYVADPGLGAVAFFPSGSGSSTAVTTVGTSLTAPTGVAVDGAGEVFIGDSGNVIFIPVSGNGLNAAGQVTIKTGLGKNLKLAADGRGAVYVADPDNHRVVELSGLGGTFGLLAIKETDITGFSAPSAIALDTAKNLYVADGSNLYEVTSTGIRTTLLSSLSGVTGLAVDASGSVYVTMGGSTLRIPTIFGPLNLGAASSVAVDDKAATSVALDPAGNVYVSNTTSGDVEAVTSSAIANFGTLTSTTGSATQTFSILNTGNLALNITGFAGTADFTATATTCTGGPVVIDGTCSVTVTFNPGPGDQGTLSGSVTATGDEANVPVGVVGTGVGAALAASKTTATAANPTTDNAPTVVTVASASGTGPSPTGTVNLTITGGTLTAPLTATGTLSGGTATLVPPQLAAGTYTFTVKYVGDRNYSGSSTTLTVKTAAGAVSLVQPSLAQVKQALPTYPYILASGSGADEPYDGSVTQYLYTYPVKVVTADGAPLIGTPYYSSTGKLEGMNYGSITFQGAPAGSNCVPVAVAADGTASWATSCLSLDTSNSAIPNIENTYTITPVYSPAGANGDAVGYPNPNYTSFTGTPITFTALRNPMVQITSNPPALTVSAGSTTTATLTLTSLLGYGIAGSGGLLNNYSLPLQLGCDGLPAYATCTFTYPKPDPTDPNSVDVGPIAGTVLSYRGAAAAPCTAAQGCVGPGTVIMTITTNVPTGAVSAVRSGKSETTYAAIFGLGLLGLTFGKRKSLRGRLLLVICLLSCGGVMAGISGCSTTQLGTTTGNPTPSGTYTVQVTAKQVGSQAVSGTPPITYGNQNEMSLPFTVNLTVQ
ncbi:MAG TPA: Ig-like domain repeat protein [Acidobacteriaceae bacterium]|nr:Ig-like domain repeat protein [Acidobacteriaceae bacterium]